MPAKRILRYVLIAIAAIVVLAAGTVAVLIVRFDPNEYKGQIVQAVKQATGRDLALNGKIGMKISLTPTVELEDVALSNPPGFSRPNMASLQRLDVQLSLLPLLSNQIQIGRLILIKPDVLLETGADGRNNWTFAPEAPAPAPAATAPKEAGKKPPPSLSVGAIRILDARFGMRDGKAGTVTAVSLPKLEIAAKSPDAPMHTDLTVVVDGTTYDVVADTGSLNGLQNAASPPWPFKIALTIKGEKRTDAALTLAGSVGSPAGLSAKGAAYPLDLTIQSAGATISVKGSIADAAALTGVKLALSAQIPDLAALSPLAGTSLPPLKTIAFNASVTEAEGGLPKGVNLHELNLSTPFADLAGDVAVHVAGKPSVTATLKSNRIDADALQAALVPTPVAQPAAAPAAPAAKAPAKPAAKRLFSDDKLPLDGLKAADANVALAVGDLHTGGAGYKNIAVHAVLKNGTLTVDPFAADLPGGHLAGTLVLADQPAGVHVTLRAPGLALKPLLAMAHQQGVVSGNLELFADLRGSGDSAHAIASTLDGHLGIAVANGTVDSKTIAGAFGSVMDAVNSISLTGHKDGNELKCFAIRLDASHGVGTFKALALDSPSLTMTGTGSLNFGAETLDMSVRPQVRAAGTGLLVIPLNITGSMSAPSVKLDAVKSATANVTAIAGAFLGNATPLGAVAGLTGADKLVGLADADICPPALAAARGQPIPAASAPEPAPAQKAAPNPLANPAGALKNLFR
jgi:uncharacterized protein involved in outer membrane biogenesis